MDTMQIGGLEDSIVLFLPNYGNRSKRKSYLISPAELSAKRRKITVTGLLLVINLVYLDRKKQKKYGNNQTSSNLVNLCRIIFTFFNILEDDSFGEYLPTPSKYPVSR